MTPNRHHALNIPVFVGNGRNNNNIYPKRKRFTIDGGKKTKHNSRYSVTNKSKQSMEYTKRKEEWMNQINRLGPGKKTKRLVICRSGRRRRRKSKEYKKKTCKLYRPQSTTSLQIPERYDWQNLIGRSHLRVPINPCARRPTKHCSRSVFFASTCLPVNI